MALYRLNRPSLALALGTSLVYLLWACPGPLPVRNTPGLIVSPGIWQWDSTTTPTYTLTPKIAGYSQQIQVYLGQSIQFYRNDTLVVRLAEALDDPKHLIQLSDTSIVVKYHQPESGYVWGSPVYVRYTILATNRAESLVISDSMASYSEQADSVHHYYRMVGPPPTLYPD